MIDRDALKQAVHQFKDTLSLKPFIDEGNMQAVADILNTPSRSPEFRVPVETMTGAELLINMFQEFGELSVMLRQMEKLPEHLQVVLLPYAPLVELLVHNAAVVVPVQKVRAFVEPLAQIPGPTGEPILRPRELADEDGLVAVRSVEWQLEHLITRRGSLAEAVLGRPVRSEEVAAALYEPRAELEESVE